MHFWTNPGSTFPASAIRVRSRWLSVGPQAGWVNSLMSKMNPRFGPAKTSGGAYRPISFLWRYFP